MSTDGTLYALLEVDPGAPDEELRRAYKRITTLFAPNAMATYGLYRQDEAERLLERMKRAYETLLDPQSRREYHRLVFPEGHPSLRRADQRVATTPPTPRAAPPANPLVLLGHDDGTPLSGATLAAVRGLSGVTLEDIADRTKISMYTLRCIEGEQHQDLPAPVYLKGFLKQIAGMLRLDPRRLVDDYMVLHIEWRAERDRKAPWRSRR